jgi:hypothetical protein
MKLQVPLRVNVDARVVTGADGIKAQGKALFQQSGELDALVAAHTGVRGSSRLILGHKVIYDIELESL